MSTHTAHYNLTKPAYTDKCDIDVINDNMDTIDTTIYEYIKTVYPVGSIYMSASNTNPGTLFPGTTWSQLKDRFLLGAGTTYTAGATGGAASQSYTPAGSVGNHKLTVDEIPSHNHSHNISATTASAGGSHTHSVPAHKHGLGSHTHTMEHSHGLNSHTHSISSHTHSLNSHTHSIPNHTHTISATSKSDDLYATAGKKVGFFPCDLSTGSDWSVLSVTTSHTNETHGLVLSDTTSSSGGGTTGAASGNTGGSGTLTTGASSGNTAKYTGNTGAASGNTANSDSLTSGSTSISHTHTVTVSGSIGNTGGNGNHNHGFTGTAATINTLPPYLVVYMWQRTA